MANIKSAKKRAKQAEGRRQRNVNQRSAMRTSVKKLIAAIDAGNKEEAQTLYVAATSSLDAAASKGLIHANKAARHKSRLNKRVVAMA